MDPATSTPLKQSRGEEKLPPPPTRLDSKPDKPDSKADESADHSRALGEYITSMYSSCPRDTSQDLVTGTSSLPLSDDVLRNIRDDFYLQIITRPDARALLMQRIECVIDAMVNSKQFSRYVPEDTKPVNVFQCGKLVAQIKTTISTIGTFGWNDVVVKREKGLSRIHAVIMLVKDATGKVMMMVIDGWSLAGTCVLDRQNNILEKSKGNLRCILISDLSDCAKLCFAMETFIFSPMEGKSCAICMEHIREARLKCGHGVACLMCTRLLTTCPVCREPVVPYQLDVSMCMDSFR